MLFIHCFVPSSERYSTYCVILWADKKADTTFVIKCELHWLVLVCSWLTSRFGPVLCLTEPCRSLEWLFLEPKDLRFPRNKALECEYFLISCKKDGWTVIWWGYLGAQQQNPGYKMDFSNEHRSINISKTYVPIHMALQYLHFNPVLPANLLLPWHTAEHEAAAFPLVLF